MTSGPFTSHEAGTWHHAEVPCMLTVHMCAVIFKAALRRRTLLFRTLDRSVTAEPSSWRGALSEIPVIV